MNAKIVHPQEPIDRSILERTLEDALKAARRHLKAFASNSDFIPKMQLDGKVLQIEKADISWIGNSGDWYDSANWSNGIVPKANDDVTIDISAQNITISFSEGEPSVNSLSLFVRNGGVLSLPELTSYNGAEGFSTNLEAVGTDSRLNLSQVTSLAGGYGVYLDAYEGGEIDLSSLPEITSGTVYVTAEDAGSQVNLSSLTSFVDESGYSELAVRDGGEILADKLTSLDGVDLSVRGNSSINTSQITSLSNSSVRVEGTTLDLSGLESIDGLDFYLGDGATLDLSQIASYQGREDGASNSLEVYGAGSRLNLSQVTSLAGGYGVYLDAYEGGEIDLSSQPEITSGSVYVTAEDNGSQVNLSSLTSFVDESGYSELAVRDGGEILADKLTSLDGVDLSVRGNSSINTSQITSLSDSSVRVEGTTLDLSGLDSIDGLNFYLGDGATLDLSQIASYQGREDGASNSLEVYGAGSSLDLSQVTSLAGGYGVYLDAYEGGEIDLSSLPEITSGTVYVTAEDAGSQVNLSSLTSFVDESGYSKLAVRDGGSILADKLATLEGIDLLSDNSNLSLTGLNSYVGDNSVRAIDGGKIGLNDLSEIVGGILTVSVDGNGSTIELSAEVVEHPFLPEETNGGQILVGGKTLAELPFIIAPDEVRENTTWSGLVKVFADVTVPENVTLTVAPGTRIIFYQDSIGLDVQGTLNVEGTVEQTVTFTRWPDGSESSDNSTLVPGSWQGINFSGAKAQGNLEGVAIRYADRAIEGIDGAKVNLSNAVLENNNQGIYVYSPLVEITAENTLMGNNQFNGIFQRADSRGIFRNCTIVGNGYGGSDSTAAGIHLGGANLTLENCIVAFNRNGLDHSGDLPLTNVNHSIFYNPDGEEIIWETGDPGLPDLSQNGNINANPLFIDRQEGNYQLLAGSPAIDAGRGTDAPNLDLLGQSRYDDLAIANSGEGTPDYVDIGSYEYQGKSLTADLAIIAIANPAPDSLEVGEEFTTSYTVSNLSSIAASGNWVDRLYLSGDPYISPDDALLQTQQENRSLAAGESYTESLTLAVPEVAGTQYLLVVTDAGRAIAEANENNNLGIASQSLAIDVPLLTVGNLVNGEVQQGQWTFVRFAGEPGKTVRINLDSSDDSGILALYTQYATTPNAIAYEGLAALEQSDQEIRILNPRAGTYYLGIYGQWVSGDATSFTLSASLTQPALHSITQTKVDNSGQATLELVGDNFSAADKIKLVAPDGITELLPVSVANQDSTRTYATFDFQGVNVGTYDVVVENPDAPQPLVLLDALSVTAPVTTDEHNFVADLIVPDLVRPGREVTLSVQYSNPNSTDLLSPLLHLKSDLVLEWQISCTDRWISGSSIEFLAVSKDGSASILAPGDTDSVDLKIRTPFSTGELNFTLYGVGIGENDRSGEAINWDSLKTNSRPPGIDAETWEAIWNNLTSQTGNTWDDFVAMLGDNAAYLAGLGQPVEDVGRLLAFELLQASGLNPSFYLTGAQDAFVPAPGLDLNFNRVYAQSLLSRYKLGALGRGWRHNYEIYLQQSDEGNILAYGFDSLPRLFAPNPSGGYDSAAGDRGVLSIDSDGTFSLREADGRLYHFRSDLRLDSLADANGNTITASYTDGNLTQLTHSSGQSLQLEYNGNGRISRLTDAAGGQTTYAYDDSGDRLLQAIEPDGRVTTYEYSTSGAELISVTNDAGDRLSYSYDALGHLAGIALNEDAGIINYSYDGTGEVTVADATGAQTNLFYDWRGLPLQVRDALGQTYQFEFDAQGNLTQIARPDGLSAEITYDDRGNPAKMVDLLGNTIGFGYEPTFNNLQWIRDARGNTIHYDYDAAGNLVEIAYADGSAETLKVDSLGNTSQYTNRRGNSIDYSYNNGGLMVRQDYEDGSSVEYAYDERGNLTAATNANGTTSLEYDSADRLTKITYPNGRFLEYTYDSVGRRTKIVDQQGFTVNYSYDSAGRLTGLRDKDGTAIVSYSYDGAGRLVREDNGNGTYTTYAYDPAGQLLSLVNFKADNTVNSRFDYTYDDLGRRTSATSLEGKTQYTYDAIGQLTGVTLPDNRTIEYEYDAAGNRLAVTDSGALTAYTTDNLNHYTTVGSASYSYDTDGNLIGKTEANQIWTYTYDIESRLVSALTPDGTWTYEYDALGNRVASIHNGQRTEYLLDPTGLVDIVAEYDGSGQAIAHYTQGLGLVSRVDASNGTTYYDSDAIGSIVGLTDTGGDYLNRYSYLPFGEELSKNETVVNPFEYVGQWGVVDEGNDLDFMRARFYDPSIGRFVSEDPLGLTLVNGNLVEYAGNNPISYIDPTGLDKKWNLFDFLLEKYEYWNLRDPERYGDVQTLRDARDLAKDSYGFEQTLQERNRGRKSDFDVARAGVDLMGSVGGAVPYLPFDSPLVIDQFEPIKIASSPLEFAKYFIQRVIDWYEQASNALQGIFDWTESGGGNNELDRAESSSIASVTPEDKFGPAGYDAPDTPAEAKQRFLSLEQPLHYRVDFWNKPNAVAPTQTAIIRDTLDPDLDWSTLSFSKIGFLKWNVDLPGGQTIDTRVDMRPDFDLAVDVNATFNPETGAIEWTFQAVDPLTGELPSDPMAGFLPPFNEQTQYELGWVEFNVKPKADLPTGTEIQNQAFVQFDLVGPFNPAPKPDPWLNTIDADPPASAVEALPATTNNGAFTVKWSGSDSGSGMSSYDLYVSVDGSPFNLWLNDTTNTETAYTGQSGHTYAFYSVATDNVGNLEAAPTQADAVITVVATLLFGTMGNDNDTENPALKLSSPTNTYIVFSGAGDDTIDAIAPGSTAKDRLYPGSGQDNSIAGTNDRLLGGEGNDTLNASSGGGNNRLYGGGGDDLLLAGSNDILCGGAGRDKFLLANAQLPNSANLVLDFEVGSDLLSLSGLSIEGNPVSFNDLSFTQGDRGTQLSIPDLSSDTLAIFLGITADTINNSVNFELS